jgi:signal transduction histidine kinase
VEVAAYRIAQEALANVSRHAHARTCFVRLSCSDGRFPETEITYDSVGLPERSNGGVGLSSMRERAAELRGTCEIGTATFDAASRFGPRVFARLRSRSYRSPGRRML